MIVIATCEAYPNASAGIDLISEALMADGHEVRCIPWQHDDRKLFCEARCVLPLGVWDYAGDAAGFKQWVSAISDGGGKLLNTPDVVLNNMNKIYLLDLADKGINVTPTHYIRTPSLEQVRLVQQSEGWQDIVLKPVYGQSGNHVTRYSSDLTCDATIFDSEEGILVQPFIREIQLQGELSLCFITGAFSHAVCRMPAKHDWRANTRYDVSVSQVELAQGIIDQAAYCLEHLKEIPLYARVDGVVTQGRFMLTELELIEPALFFDKVYSPAETALNRFVALVGAV